ncbi:MAG: hypothetical protein NW207_00250 [Cytophagales bacterium]|nr:hypothetical protein [Cytophagales bacterium]
MKNIILLSITIFLASCYRETKFKKFNPEYWKNDYNGCDGNREVQIKYLYDEKNVLIGVTEFQLREILGKPNKQYIYDRNKKKYIYYTSPGKQCHYVKYDAKILIADMDALNRVVQFTIKFE